MVRQPRPPDTPSNKETRLTLDYRTPKTANPRVQHIMQQLLVAQSLSWVGIAIKLMLGIPLCLLGPLVLALSIGALAPHDTRVPGFAVVFFLSTLIVFPILLFIERRTNGRFLEDSLIRSSSYLPPSTAGYLVRGDWTMLLLRTEFILYGPRLIWSVIDSLRGNTSIDPTLRRAAAEIVVDLLDRGEAMSVRELIGPNTPGPVVSAALRLLQQIGWVDLSRQRDRAWLSSRIRSRLKLGNAQKCQEL